MNLLVRPCVYMFVCRAVIDVARHAQIKHEQPRRALSPRYNIATKPFYNFVSLSVYISVRLVVHEGARYAQVKHQEPNRAL